MSTNYIGEFAKAVESSVQITEEPSGNGAVEVLRDLIEVVVSGFLWVVWTVLRTLVCFAATGWIGVIVLAAAFLSSAILFLRYRVLSYDWHKAIAVGVITSLPVLVIRILC